MGRPLEFLFLTTFYPPYSFGGDGMCVYRLAHALGDAGHHVDVAHCVDAYHLLHPGCPEIPFAEHPNVTRHELRSRWKWLSPLATQQTGRPWLKQQRLRELFDSKPYDAVHYHNVSLLGAQALAMAPTRRAAVRLYTAHEHWLVCPMHVLWKYTGRPCDKPECLKCAIAGRRPPQFWRYTGLLERSARHVDQFLSPSRFTARMHAERGFPRPLLPFPYFTSRVDEDWRDPAPRPQERPYFLFVGRLELIKGLHTVIPLWESMPDCDLLVAGTGTYEGELRRAAAGNPRVEFLGPLSQRELGPLYYHALACIVPSVTYETFGLVSIEAFARKTPVIVRDLGALPEIVEDSGGGFTYRTDEELLAAMRRIADARALRAELGERGYAAFDRLWTKEAHLEKYSELIEEITEKKSGRGIQTGQPALPVRVTEV